MRTPREDRAVVAEKTIKYGAGSAEDTFKYGLGPQERTLKHGEPAGSAPLKCGRCGKLARTRNQLRRGRCWRCYRVWLRHRPMGKGAACAACDDRRLSHLRHHELEDRWVVLCHNCTARARSLEVQPRTVEGLLWRLERDRRYGDRRVPERQTTQPRKVERRATPRREQDLPRTARATPVPS